MKKFLVAAAALLTSMSLWAEGYQVNLFSAKQIGMGHTGTALKLGAESMIFNPGALGFSDKTLDIAGSVTALKSIATAEPVTGGKYETQNPISTPLGINVAFRIYDNLQAGITFYTPYGSGIDWTKNWPGAELNQSCVLKVYDVQPTIAWRITPKLSVGVGMMLSWGTVDLNKGLVSGRTIDQLMGTQLQDIAAASVNLKGTSQVALGANIGVMYDINRQWSVGANFRTKMGMKVKAGIASVDYANEAIKERLETVVGLINKANFSAEMPCPWVLNIGGAFKPTDRLTLAADVQLTGWKAYKELNIEFPGQLSAFNQNITKDYKNAMAYKVGAQYALTNRMDLRAGLMVDCTPVNKNYYNPETPGMTKIEPTVGFSFRPIERLSVDIAFMYIQGLGEDNAKCSYQDLLLKNLGQPESVYTKTFEAKYKVHAFAPSIGINYCF